MLPSLLNTWILETVEWADYDAQNSVRYKIHKYLFIRKSFSNLLEINLGYSSSLVIQLVGKFPNDGQLNVFFRITFYHRALYLTWKYVFKYSTVYPNVLWTIYIMFIDIKHNPQKRGKNFNQNLVCKFIIFVTIK